MTKFGVIFCHSVIEKTLLWQLNPKILLLDECVRCNATNIEQLDTTKMLQTSITFDIHDEKTITKLHIYYFNLNNLQFVNTKFFAHVQSNASMVVQMQLTSMHNCEIENKHTTTNAAVKFVCTHN